MKIKFDLTDEVTITNTTVKLTVLVEGVINGADRPTLEASALELTNKLFSDVKWSFSNFRFMPDGFTFQVQAAARIDSAVNDQLDTRANAISERGKLTLQVIDTDVSIPLHQKRKAESDLRVALIEKAQAEASKLNGQLAEVVFTQSRSTDYSNSMRGATYAASSSFDAKGGAEIVNLGHSEKILLSASILVDTATARQLNG